MRKEARVLQSDHLAIKNLRKAAEITQVQLAQIIGVHLATVAQWESGKYQIPVWVKRFIECLWFLFKQEVDLVKLAERQRASKEDELWYRSSRLEFQKRRLAMNMNQLQMAKTMGVHPTSISRWESVDGKIPFWALSFSECILGRFKRVISSAT